MARDEYDHLRESADADSSVDSKFVLVDQINGNAFGLFDSSADATTAARTGADFVGGIPWGEDGWEVVTLADFKRDHDEEGVNAYWVDITRGATGQAVIAEISDEIDNGDAHLLTRNQLAEFVEWLITDENATIDDLEAQDTIEINSIVTDFMNYGEFRPLSKAYAQEMAKRFFIVKGYEKGDLSSRLRI